jgi:hypothetical protein
VKDTFVTCALCGHQFPASFVRQRGHVTCNCGLRIDAASFAPVAHARAHALALMLLAIVIALLTAAFALAHRLLG